MEVKTVEVHIDKLIEFYREYNTEDLRLKKLIIRNLQDIKRRYKKEKEK